MAKNGLCFSGGGIKAFVHIGALKALEEKNIKFDMVAGTSSGSIIAVLYALGYKSDEMYKILTKYISKLRYIDIGNIFKIILGLICRGRIIVSGLNSGKILTKSMRDVCEENKIKTIDEIKMPIVIPAVNLQNGEVIVFSSKETRKTISDEIKYVTNAPIEVAVRSSCSFPGVYSPCIYNNMQLVDGGVRENVAWKELKAIGADKVLGINFETVLGELDFCENMIEVAISSISLLEHELSNYELDGIDELITITLKKVGLLDKTKINYLHEIGYKTAKRCIEEKKIYEKY